MERYEQTSFTDKSFHVFDYSVKSTGVYKLFQQVKASSFQSNLNCNVGDFLKYDPNSRNYEEIFTEVVNNPFSLYILYLEIFFFDKIS